MSKLQKIFGY